MLVQWERPYILDAPVTLVWHGGKKTESFQVEKKRTRLVMDSGIMPERVSLDEEYDVARKLSRREFPPVIARLLGSEKIVLVPPPAEAEMYGEVVETFLQKGAVLRDSGGLNRRGSGKRVSHPARRRQSCCAAAFRRDQDRWGLQRYRKRKSSQPGVRGSDRPC